MRLFRSPDAKVSVTPIELRHVRFRKRLFGYDRSACDQLLERFGSTFEEVWVERDGLREEVKELEVVIASQQAALDADVDAGAGRPTLAPVDSEYEPISEQPGETAPATQAAELRLHVRGGSKADPTHLSQPDLAQVERRRAELEREVRELEFRRDELKRDYKTLLSKAVGLVESADERSRPAV